MKTQFHRSPRRRAEKQSLSADQRRGAARRMIFECLEDRRMLSSAHMTFAGVTIHDEATRPGGAILSQATIDDANPWYSFSSAYRYLDGWNHRPRVSADHYDGVGETAWIAGGHAAYGTDCSGWNTIDSAHPEWYAFDFEGYEYDRTSVDENPLSSGYGHEYRWYDGTGKPWTLWDIRIPGHPVQIANGALGMLHLDIDYGLGEQAPNIRGDASLTVEPGNALFNELVSRWNSSVLKMVLTSDEPPFQSENGYGARPDDKWALFGFTIDVSPTPRSIIAAMGDSYASGQGNPATKWTENSLPTWLTEDISTDWMFPNLTIRTAGDNASYNRSPYAASVLLARSLAASKPGSSVDLIFAPQSGATMATAVNDDDNPIGASIQVTEIVELMDALPGSDIDILTLSFGGNDIGFDRIIKTMACASLLSEADRVDVKEALEHAVEEGTGWKSVRDILLEAEGAPVVKALLSLLDLMPILSPSLRTFKVQVTANGWPAVVYTLLKDVTDSTGLNNLKWWYNRLKEDVNYYLNPQHVFITEYPAPYLDKNGNIGGFPLLPLPMPFSLTITADDAKWIDDIVVKPLNAAVFKAAEANGWSYVGEVRESFQGHQYSDVWAKSWYRTLLQSVQYQAGFGGTLHPNEAGHRQIAAQLYTAMFPWVTQSTIKQTLKSHADLHIYDPSGRHLGVNRVTGELEEQIPGGTLTYYLDANQDGIYEPSEEQHPTDYLDIPTDWVQIATLPELLAGDYQTELIGTSNGSFELIVQGSQSDASVPGEEFSGTIYVGDRLLTTTTVTGVDGSLALLFAPLVATPTMQINPQYPERMVVTPGTTSTLNASISEIGGRMGLSGVTIHATDLVGPWGTIPGSSVTFSSNDFDLAASGTQSITVSCDIPADFWGTADGQVVVESADGGGETLDLRLKFESLNVSPLEVTPRFPRDGIVEVNASFLDLDEFAAHTVMVDWGDGGFPVLIPVDEAGGFGMITASHVYAETGDYVITVTVTDDGGASVSTTAPVYVGNVQPVAVPDSYDAAESLVLEVTAATGVLANDQDANEDTLRAVPGKEPRHGVLVLADDGSFTYTPAANFNREDSFTYQASDGLMTSDPVTVTITLQTTHLWHNGIEPLNVNDDGYFDGDEYVDYITPIDALQVINELNRNGGYELPTDRPRPLAPPFYDVNRDGFVSPIDALQVINYLNRNSGNGSEGEVSTLDGLTGPADGWVARDSAAATGGLDWFLSSHHAREAGLLATPNAGDYVTGSRDYDGDRELLLVGMPDAGRSAAVADRWRPTSLRFSTGGEKLEDLLAEIADDVSAEWSRLL